jgi:hypothetical protein
LTHARPVSILHSDRTPIHRAGQAHRQRKRVWIGMRSRSSRGRPVRDRRLVGSLVPPLLRLGPRTLCRVGPARELPKALPTAPNQYSEGDPRAEENPARARLSGRADARTRTGDPFITSDNSGGSARSGIATNAHEIPANRRKSGCTFVTPPDRAKSTWWTLNGRRTAKVRASHRVTVRDQDLVRGAGGSEACQ